MSDEAMKMNHLQAGDENGYEHQDLSPGAVFYFMAGLVVFTVIMYFVIFGMYRFLDSYNKANQAPMSPMVAPPADTRTVTRSDTQAFPQPRLEENERNELRQFIVNQESQLATYNWVDQDKGIVQIPIDRAMDLIVERGLPVRAEGSSSENKAQTSAPGNKHSPKAAAAKAASGN